MNPSKPQTFTRYVLCAALWLGLGLGCVPGYDTPPIQYETERAVIGTTWDYPLCGADLGFVDHHVEFVERTLQVSHSQPVRLFLYEFDDDLPCGVSPFGCWHRESDEITTVWWGVSHEVVHSVSKDLDMPSLFWSEGLATALRSNGTIGDGSGVLDNYNIKNSSALQYNIGGHFVRWLFHTRGAEQVQRIYRGESVEAVFGLTIEQLSDEHYRTAPFTYPAWEPCPYPALEADGDNGWSEDFEFDCGSPDATSTVEFAAVSVVRTVALEAGSYRLRQDGGELTGVLGCQMVPYASELAEQSRGDVYDEAEFSHTAPLKRFEAGINHDIELTAGVYKVVIIADIDSGARGRLTMEQL